MGLFFESPPALLPLVKGALHQALVEPAAQDPALAAQRADEQATAIVDHSKQLVRDALQRAYVAPPQTPDAADAQSTLQAKAIVAQTQQTPRFLWSRFVGAFGIFALLVVGGIVAETVKLSIAPTALFGMATTVLGVVVAFFGTEKPS